MKVTSKTPIYVPSNARTVTITPGKESLSPISINGEIQALELGDSAIIRCGDVIKVKNKPYKVNIIQKTFVNRRVVYKLSSAELTKASMFAMPMLTGNRRLFMFDSLFVNCFIGTEKHKDSIVLLYRFSGDTTFLKFEQALKQFKGFVETFDPSPHFVAFVFKIPENYLEDYEHFVHGRYSKMSLEYKHRILDFHGFTLDGELAQILFKAPEKRRRLEGTLGMKLDKDSELYSVLVEEEEIFNPKVYL